MTSNQIEQGSDEWFLMKLGKISGSRISDLLTEGRGGKESLTKKKYRNELIRERLTGKRIPNFKTALMHRGIELEPLARSAYEHKFQMMVDQIAFIDHPTIAMAGCSPDGLINDDGLLEIKCPSPENHIDNLLNNGIQLDQYYDQVQWQLCVCQRSWCHLISFDPEMPEHLQIYCKLITLDDEWKQRAESAVIAFNAEIETILTQLKEIQNGNNT
jgi:putative phage-type endonuclease